MVINEGLEVLGTAEYPSEEEDVNKSKKWCGVFEGSALESIELPSTLKRIEYRVFFGCKNLKHIELPENLEHIGNWCFCGSGLEKTMILKPVKSIGDGVFKDSALEKIVVEEGC